MFNVRFTRTARAVSLRLRAGAVVLAAAVLAAVACAAPAAAWEPPQRVNALGMDTLIYSLATGADGSTTAAWSETAGVVATVMTATRSATGGFGAPIAASPFGDTDGGRIDVAITPDGSVTVVWPQDTTSAIRVATKAAGASTYGDPQTLGIGGDPQLAIAHDGTTLAVWADGSGSGNVVRAAIRPPGATAFGTAWAISETGHDGREPQPVASPDGSFTVIWHGQFNGTKTVEAASLPAGGSSFGAVQTISAMGPVLSPSNAAVAAASAGDGTLIVAWGNDASPATLWTATRPAGATAFGSPEALSTATWNGSNLGLDAVAAPDGTVAVAWAAKDTFTAQYAARVAVRTAGTTTFGSAQQLSPPDVVGDSPSMTVAPDGRFTVAWYDGNILRTLRTATLAPGTTTFTNPETVGAGTQPIEESHIVATIDGTPVLMWNGAETGTNLLYASWGSATTYPLTVVRAGNGRGRITSTPAGINCGATCTSTITLSTRVILTAKPTHGSVFAGWTGACAGTSATCVVSVLGARTATARFAATVPSKVRHARSRPAGKAMIALWQAPVSTGGARSFSYQTRIRGKGGTWSAWTTQRPIAGRTWQSRAFRGLERGQAYAVQIRARSAAGAGSSVRISFVVPSSPPRGQAVTG
ncbi:MAG: InlB B-repeat-containing protein [Gaiellales bacterium]